MILRTQLKEGQNFDDPSTIYFAELNVQSGILFALVKSCYNKVTSQIGFVYLPSYDCLLMQSYYII